MRVACPQCGKRLNADTAHAGKLATCPGCRTRFRLDHGAGEVTADASGPPRREAAKAARPQPAGAAGLAFAEAAGIRLHEQLETQVAGATEAAAGLSAWLKDFPEVPSSYRPSGALPAAALPSLLLGALLGVPVGVLVGGVLAAVGCLVVWWFLNFLNGTFVFGSVFGVVVFLIVGMGFGGLGMGVSAAWCTTLLGKWGKNRNTTAAVLLSMASTALAMVLACVLFWSFGPAVMGVTYGDKPAYPDIIAAVVVGLIAVSAAGLFAPSILQDAKFCDDCERYMVCTPLDGVCLGNMRALTRALGDGNAAVAADVLQAAQPGNEGKPELFACPQCRKGYIELNAQYKVTWVEKKEKKEKKGSWRIASLALSAGEVERFNPP
jgi:hypothetical protein